MDSDFSVLSVFEWGDGCGAHSLLIRSFLSFETRLLYAVARSGDTVGVGRGGPQHLDPPCGLRQLTTHPTSPLSPCLLFVCFVLEPHTALLRTGSTPGITPGRVWGIICGSREGTKSARCKASALLGYCTLALLGYCTAFPRPPPPPPSHRGSLEGCMWSGNAVCCQQRAAYQSLLHHNLSTREDSRSFSVIC